MTHIENIPHIINYGITHSKSKNANSRFTPIGDNSLINTRNKYPLENGKLLGDYIPFYFGYRTPMLYVIQNGRNSVPQTLPDNIVYCITSVKKIIDHKLDFVFTDGHAVDKFTSQFNRSHINDINKIINWEDVNAKYWKNENDLDLKRRKEAEFLVLGDIPKSAILGFVCYSEKSELRLQSFGINAKEIIIRPNYFF